MVAATLSISTVKLIKFSNAHPGLTTNMFSVMNTKNWNMTWLSWSIVGNNWTTSKQLPASIRDLCHLKKKKKSAEWDNNGFQSLWLSVLITPVFKVSRQWTKDPHRPLLFVQEVWAPPNLPIPHKQQVIMGQWSEAKALNTQFVCSCFLFKLHIQR